MRTARGLIVTTITAVIAAVLVIPSLSRAESCCPEGLISDCDGSNCCFIWGLGDLHTEFVDDYVAPCKHSSVAVVEPALLSRSIATSASGSLACARRPSTATSIGSPSPVRGVFTKAPVHKDADQTIPASRRAGMISPVSSAEIAAPSYL